MTYQEILSLVEANSKSIDNLFKNLDNLTEKVESLSDNLNNLSEKVESLSDNLDKLSKNVDKLAASSHAAQVRWDNFMERYGGYVDNDSRKVENFFIEGLEQLDLVLGSLKFEEIIPNAQRRKKKVVTIELDALLINGTTVGILEVKSTLHVNDVEKIRDKLIRRFRDYYPEYQAKQLAVIVAGELINPDAAELAHELGYIVLKPKNQGIDVDASCYRSA